MKNYPENSFGKNIFFIHIFSSLSYYLLNLYINCSLGVNFLQILYYSPNTEENSLLLTILKYISTFSWYEQRELKVV